MRIVLLLAYPLLAHLSVLLDSPGLQWAAMQCMLIGLFLTSLKQRRLLVWFAFCAFAAATGMLARFGGGLYALFVPPLAVPALIQASFGSSLLPGHTPLITRLAEAIHGELPAPLLRYTRSVTWLWTVVLAALLLAIAYFMIFGPLAVWSAIANFGSYLLVGTLLVGEYLYRRLRFRDFDHVGFVESMRHAATVRVR